MTRQLSTIFRCNFRNERLCNPLLNVLAGRRDEDIRKNDGHNNGCQSMRYYHATTRKEILPLIAIGVGAVGFYSIRALRRMDQDWEDHQESLREYNLEHGIHDDESDNLTGEPKAASNASASQSNNTANTFKGGTMVMDLGTLNIRIAYKPYSPVGNSKANVVVNREGARATPSCILYDPDGSFVTGNLASAKLYERSKASNPVVNPGKLLRGHQNGNRADVSIKNQMIEEVISSCAKDALEQVLGSNKVSSGSKSLFSINSGMGGYNVKPVFTYPPSYGLNEEDCLKTYKDALGGLSFPDSIATFIPEPVSAVQAAKSLALLKAPEGPVLGGDVGAAPTTLSIVDSGKIQYHSSLNGFGGETLINALMDYMSKEFYGRHHEDVDDQMGVQRLYDAAQGAIMEISSQSKKSHGRVQINIPFLSVDEKMKPRHLNIGVSASVLEAEFNDMVAKEIVPQFAIKQDVLSLSMQNPTDLSLLFSSMIMRVFEESNQNPFALNSLLVVGGGARSPIIQKAIRNACATLAGEQFVQDKVIVPKDELVEELVVLGGTVK